MHRIWFNGKGYSDPDAMPPEVRRQYEEALGRRGRARRTGGSDVIRVGHWEDDGDQTLEVHTSREIVINGKRYSDFDELPPREREMVRKMMGHFPPAGGVDLDEFLGDGLIDDLLESGAGGDRQRRKERPVHEVVLRSSRELRTPTCPERDRWSGFWSNGWAVALVLAIALLWLLIFGG